MVGVYTQVGYGNRYIVSFSCCGGKFVFCGTLAEVRAVYRMLRCVLPRLQKFRGLEANELMLQPGCFVKFYLDERGFVVTLTKNGRQSNITVDELLSQFGKLSVHSQHPGEYGPDQLQTWVQDAVGKTLFVLEGGIANLERFCEISWSVVRVLSAIRQLITKYPGDLNRSRYKFTDREGVRHRLYVFTCGHMTVDGAHCTPDEIIQRFR